MTSQDSSTHERVPFDCGFDHDHSYPADWVFGGANGRDPRADPRWRGDTYTYFSDRLVPLHVTQVPLCDEQAIDNFTEVTTYGPGFDPKWVQVKRHDSGVVETLKVIYDPETDEVWDT